VNQGMASKPLLINLKASMINATKRIIPITENKMFPNSLKNLPL
jgi:hypothetical protein